MPPIPLTDPASRITHEVVKENEHLPVFFSSPSRGPCKDRCTDNCEHSFILTCNKLTIPVHWHEYIEFIYILDAPMTAVVQADTYEINQGDLLIINCEELHMTQIAATSTPYILIQFSADRLRELFSEADLLHFNTCISKEELAHHPKILECLTEMVHLYEEDADGYQLLFTARFYEFLHELYQNFCQRKISQTEPSSNRDLKRITNIVEWTRGNFRQPLTLDDAAAHLGISREYFCRIFKKYTGQTYLDYLCTIRTSNLFEDLRDTDLSIPILMEQNGLTNYKTFIRTFKKLYGTTPQKLRRGTA